MTALSLSSQLISSFESCRLSPYQNKINGKLDKPTIGWGNTQYEDGTLVTLNDPDLTQDRADQLRDYFIQKCLDRVNKLVTVSISDSQQAALASFEYNTGALAGHTLLKLLNAGDYQGAAEQFLLWTHVNGVVNQGLFFRRSKEQSLFLEGIE